MRPRKTILIAHEDESKLSILKTVLETRCLVRVRTARNADEVLAQMDIAPEAILIGLLGDTDKLTRTIKGINPETSIVICGKAAQCFQGVADLLLPDTSMASLVNATKQAIARKRGPKKAGSKHSEVARIIGANAAMRANA